MKEKKIKPPFETPQDGDVVMSCKHPDRHNGVHYIGDENGLGMWFRTSQAGDFWCRWVVLCWVCNVKKWLRRKTPVEILGGSGLKGVWKP